MNNLIINMIFRKPNKNSKNPYHSSRVLVKLPLVGQAMPLIKPQEPQFWGTCITPQTETSKSLNNMSQILNHQNTQVLTANLQGTSKASSAEHQSYPRDPEFIPFETLDMKNLSEHLHIHCNKNTDVKTNGKIKSRKGRKKKIVFDYTNLFELIHNHVIPRWRKYLTMKSIKTDRNKRDKSRSDTIWKKVVRDVREFYRILFRMRFHYLDYKDQKGATRCMEILFEELGIPIEREYFDNMALFVFLHQTHKTTGYRLFKNLDNEGESSPFEAIENFNSITKKIFMSDKLAARLFYFVFQNFIEDYVPFTNTKYRQRIASSICLVLKCYSKMSTYDQLPRVHHLLV
ncbi:unnamed protein product [Moneuplotes crassus]|uniref:Uncharacterized protein n=1 Tax=Euplotes crassus TaxID=5936 RepID=A0AAD1Y7A6_EUPCR|nr:unnamed protein product [Moneuplotes crassus]